MTATVLIVDDELQQLRMAEHVVTQKLRYQAITAASGEEAVAWVRSGRKPQPDLLLLDLMMPGIGGVEALKAIKLCRPQLPVIVFTSYGDDANAAAAINAGAGDFLFKPVAIDRLRLSIHNALKLHRLERYIAYLEQRQAGRVCFSDMVGESPAFLSALDAARAVASSPEPAWIKGETGVGKEMLSRAMHDAARPGTPVLTVDCAGLEQEAADAKITPQQKLAAALREAGSGTLFLRDIGMLPLSLQPLLPAEGQGARIICSSPSDPQALASQGWLHRDLLKRINRVVVMPSLAERRSDIPLLARHFVCRYAASERKHMYGLASDAVSFLTGAVWPGNVRQLTSLLWRAVMICNQELLDAGNIRLIQQWQPAHYQESAPAAPALTDGNGRIKKLRMIEEDAIRLALHHANGSMTRAARSLGIGRSTLYRRVHELELGGYISRENQTTRPMISASETPRS